MSRDPSMRGIPAIGPGAKRSPRGQYLIDQGRHRKSSPTWRKVWCAAAGCPGHVDEERCK